MIEFSELDWKIMQAIAHEQMKEDFNALPKIYEGTWEDTQGQAIIITEEENVILLDAEGNLKYI